MTGSELAVREGLRQQTISESVTALAHLELLERRADPHDGRKLAIVLTSRGDDAARQSALEISNWLQTRMEVGLTKDERDVLASSIPLLAKLVDVR
jgi:DNA-binding MarR family transcriptional regulator